MHARYLQNLPKEYCGVNPNKPWKALLNVDMDEEESLRQSTAPVDVAQVITLDEQAVQALHDKWCHPCESKMTQIVKFYKGKGFPTGFMTALRKFHCRICALCKGARNYRHTKRVTDKIKTNKTKKSKQKQIIANPEIP